MFALRPMTDDDLMMVLEWRNQPHVREHMYTTHVISEEEHRAYFARVKDDVSKQYLICTDEEGTPVGLVNFVDIDPANGTAFWGFYSGDPTRRGVGTRMEYLALVHAFEVLNLRKLNGEVLSTNPAVLAFHEKFGFQVEGVFKQHHAVKDGYADIHRIALFRQDWLDKWKAVAEERVRKVAGAADES